MVAIGEDLVGEAQTRILDMARPMVALYVGGMGARGKNFYNTVAQRYGYETRGRRHPGPVPGRQEGRGGHARARGVAGAVQPGRPPQSYVKERIGAFKEAGVTVLSVNPVGPDPVAHRSSSSANWWPTLDRRERRP